MRHGILARSIGMAELGLDGVGVGLLTSLLTAVLFIGVLWTVGGDLSTDAFGRRLIVPGYLVLAEIAYAMLTTIGMLFMGSRLVQVFEAKNQTEAGLRRSATLLRESAPRDDNMEHRGAVLSALEQVISRWRGMRWQLMQTTSISHGNGLLAPVVGLTLCAPKYLSGSLSLGEVTQAAAAFVTVLGAFNWLVDNYARLADWASSANRVGALLISLDSLDRQATAVGVSDGLGGDEDPIARS